MKNILLIDNSKYWNYDKKQELFSNHLYNQKVNEKPTYPAQALDRTWTNALWFSSLQVAYAMVL